MAEAGSISKKIAIVKKSEKSLEAKLLDKKNLIMAELNEKIAMVNADFEVDKGDCMYWTTLWENRMSKTALIGGKDSDPDLVIITELAGKLEQACRLGILHILKAASEKMLKETNPMILIPKSVINMTTLGSIAAGVYINCLANIASTISKCFKMLGEEKVKCKAIVEGKVGEGVVELCYRLLKASSSTVPQVIDSYLVPAIDLQIPEIKAPEGDITPEAEDAFNEQIVSALDSLSEQSAYANEELDIASGLVSGIVEEYSKISKSLVEGEKGIYKPFTKEKSKAYVEASKGLIVAHDKYAKMIASQFRESKGGENPTKVLLNNCLESELSDDELKDFFGVDDEQLKQMKDKYAEEMKKAAAAETSASAPTSSSASGDNPISAAANAASQESNVQMPSSINPEEVAKDLADDAKLVQETMENFQEAAKSLTEYVNAEATSLLLDKAKDAMKKIQGDGFTDAFFSLLALKMFVDKVLKRIYLGYKNLADILKSWRVAVIEFLEKAPRECAGEKIIAQIHAALTRKKVEAIAAQIPDLTSAAKNVQAMVEDITSQLMQIYTKVTELISQVAQIVQEFISSLAKAVLDLLKQLIQVFESMLNTAAVGTGANINLPSATPLFTILLGLIKETQEEEEEEESGGR